VQGRARIEEAAMNGTHEHETGGGGQALTRTAVAATLHLPDRLCDRRGAGHGGRHCARLVERRHRRVSVVLAFVFGYSLTLGPVLQSGVAFGAALGVAFAADTVSIAVMEVIDNLIMLLVPGAMEAGLGSLLFWGSLAVALAVAFVIAVPVNRALISRGKGHAVVHRYH
jgi:hypothetical protein